MKWRRWHGNLLPCWDSSGGNENMSSSKRLIVFQPMIFVQYGQNVVIPIEGSLSPPASNKVDSSSMREAEERTQETSDGQ